MKPVELTTRRGDSKTYLLTFKDGAGAVIDITGWTVYFTAKKQLSDSDDDAAIKKDVTVHSNPTEGETKIELEPADTEALDGYLFFDIQAKTSEDKVFTVLTGKMEIIEDVTRRTT